MYTLKILAPVSDQTGGNAFIFKGELVPDDGQKTLSCAACLTGFPHPRLSYCCADINGKAVGVSASLISEVCIPDYDAIGLRYNPETKDYSLSVRHD